MIYSDLDGFVPVFHDIKDTISDEDTESVEEEWKDVAEFDIVVPLFEPFKCDLCPMMYDDDIRLRLHRSSYHVACSNKTWQCYDCKKEFRTCPQLRKHVAVHGRNRDHICNKCGKGFLNKYNLSDHYATHSDERPFVCACGKSYKLRQVLLAHMRKCSEL